MEIFYMTFDFQTLLSFDDFNSRYDYIKKCNLQRLGQGCAKITFAIDDTKVLKLSLNSVLNDQVKNVIKHQNILDKFDCFPKILDSDSINYYCYIEERVDEINVFDLYYFFYESFGFSNYVNICQCVLQWKKSFSEFLDQKEKIINFIKKLSADKQINCLIDRQNNFILYDF